MAHNCLHVLARTYLIMLPFPIVALLILTAAMPGESFMSTNAHSQPSSARYVASRDLDDSAEAAEFLGLSTSDLARIQTARSSRTVLPLIILAEPILPGQRIEFGSNDKRFHTLIAHALQNGHSNEIGVLGTNPYTGRSLGIGVTAKISASSIRRDGSDKAMVVLDVVGERRFECAGEPWMDDTSSFYLADIDYSKGRADETSSATNAANEEESITDSARVCALSESVPGLVETWMYWMAQSGVCSRTSMKQIMEVSSSADSCVFQMKPAFFTRNKSTALPGLSHLQLITNPK